MGAAWSSPLMPLARPGRLCLNLLCIATSGSFARFFCLSSAVPLCAALCVPLCQHVQQATAYHQDLAKHAGCSVLGMSFPSPLQLACLTCGLLDPKTMMHVLTLKLSSNIITCYRSSCSRKASPATNCNKIQYQICHTQHEYHS